MELPRHIIAALEVIKDNGFDARLTAFVGAVITKGGKIVSSATNSVRYASYPVRYAHHDDMHSTHAEVAAIMKVRKKVDLDGAKLWVARLKRTGDVGLSKPCPMCQEVIARHGIHRVYYTIDDNTFATWKVPNVDLRERRKQLSRLSERILTVY